jgi:hypothetical protein
MPALDAGANAMTEHVEPSMSVADTIGTLRKALFSFGRSVPWTAFRSGLRLLLIDRQPSQSERIQLLELYDMVFTRVEHQCGHDDRMLRRLGCQRALDTLAFQLAELRALGADCHGNAAAALMAREREAGRMRLDGHLAELMSLMLNRLGDGDDLAFSRRASPTSPPSP